MAVAPATGGARRTLGDVPVLVLVLAPRISMDVADEAGSMDVGPVGVSVYPAVQHLCLAARATGPGTVVTTVVRIHEVEARAVCEVPDRHEIAALVPLGHPEGRWGVAPAPAGPVADQLEHLRLPSGLIRWPASPPVPGACGGVPGIWARIWATHDGGRAQNWGSRMEGMVDEVLPLTGLTIGKVPERVIVVGDPNRAAKVARRLDRAEPVAAVREYHSYVGRHEGTEVLVMSHGVGAAGAGVCFEELLRGGARTLVRAGTAGALQDHIADGSLVIATAAVRDEGLTPRLVPLGFPAVADVDLTVALRDAAAASGHPTHVGTVLTGDLFYPHEPLGSDLPLWRDAGVAAVDMEAAALFVLAALHGARAGALFAIDGNPVRRDDQHTTAYDPDRRIVHTAVDAMIDIALTALVSHGVERGDRPRVTPG